MLVFTSILAACGQRGPLYMPGTKPPPKSTNAAKPKAPLPQKAAEPAKTDASTTAKP